MARHDPSIQKNFTEAMKGCAAMAEHDLLDALQPTILVIEKDDSYSTSAKLKIFSLITSLSNCDPKEREKFARRIARKLK